MSEDLFLAFVRFSGKAFPLLLQLMILTKVNSILRILKGETNERNPDQE